MPSSPQLKRAANGKIYIHWTEPSPIKGQRGRSRRWSTDTDDMAKAKLVLGRRLVNGSLRFSSAHGNVSARLREETLAASQARADAKPPGFDDETWQKLLRSRATALAEQKARELENKQRERIDIRDGSLTLPAAIRLANALNKSTLQKGFISARGPGLFTVSKVTPRHAGRVVRLVQALLLAVAARGYSIKAGERCSTIVVDGEPTVLSIREVETVKRERIIYSEPDPTRDRPGWRSQFTPTGRLGVQIESRYFNFPVRKFWSDSVDEKLEDKLSSVLVGLAKHAAALKRQRSEDAIREQERKLELRRAEDAAQRTRAERARIEFLDQRLRFLEEMHWIDRYLERLRTFASRDEQLSATGLAFVQWVERRAENLRQVCGVDNLEAALAKSGLFDVPPALDSERS